MTRRAPVPLRLALALSVALAVAGCETFERVFAERETPLPGERKPLFPEGVPGVVYGEPPPQPANAPQREVQPPPDPQPAQTQPNRPTGGTR